MILLKSKKRPITLLIVLVCGIIIFILGLGSTGLIDETPPLFAAAGRAMSESGDWLTPKVNGMFRFDKPPLIYWLMGFFYSLPKNEIWDSFGTISARLPSALGSLFLMLMIGDTLFCWPQKGDKQFLTPIVASLGFALSPFIIIWSRTAVSDSLLTGTLGISLLLFWRRMVSENNDQCISAWVFLGLAILTKGPVAFVLATLTISFFFISQKDWRTLLCRINLKKGFLITTLISVPWYILELVKEGKPFWDNFFGYHNFQRYTSVVNNHSEPFWFFLYMMIIASLPFTPFLYHGIIKAFEDFLKSSKDISNVSDTLYIYSLCWLISVLIFFSISATKLPSYWLPAIPAASILISRSFISLKNSNKIYSILWIFNILIFFGVSIAFFFSNIWLTSINDPEMPDLGSELISSGIIFKAKLFFSVLTLLAIILFYLRSKNIFLYLQILLLIGQPFLMSPIRKLADNSRQLPLRNISKLILDIREGNETLAMIGVRKPSLHYYSGQIVFYEPNTKEGLINLSDRLNNDRRENHKDQPDYEYKSLLVVIDESSSREKHWSNINYQKLGEYGIYNLWRIQKSDLNKYSEFLINNGYKPNWKKRKVEKF
ncbi:4-amino-4-deoxy-L-arabinose transferase and related glycosyltransferase of PMT family [Prochlorococcus marinus str. MIT 9321]|uniref:4-amino-4-deoxy-L-arabinose transferase and related glycosyltransferase of PMT family n=1 Tax=Prochlorococcus marinus str. MIT 9401 TaxID=167551 RepID=A0A0A2B9Q2_PROMR|nr:glycosyltransferase family 39 protein [Prochlorococcus marinus]KGG02909.1 4-amino-4-deoxy-L-arabinose transferase and related glycosyltransferase of PMT family [Prochlorococcus marinus str. MIT 9321]KGG05532.1 4-amino-4-deoxy-L-arabinose transferase and related glycosyltransferase of PMT family [Prochlorococcus marinus str. MIT 9322]KGG10566.1 4-amino-4-deoxy-L-arabinose transferase and related glycosyltransferase of PMT family [Prochlorococcus marinus str. MIT 9401]